MNYFALISREEFATIYKFGHIFLSKDQYFEYGENIEEVSDDLVLSLLEQSNRFEYDQEYIFVTFDFTGIFESRLEIEKIFKIYPLTEHAKKDYENSFDKRIFFEVPIFESIVNNYFENSLTIQDALDGITAFRKICQLDPSINDICMSKPKLLEGVYSGRNFRSRAIKYFDIPLENRSPYGMLIAYDRYQYYNPNFVGYYFDAADVFTYFKLQKLGDSDRPIFEGSKIFQILTKNTSKKFTEIYDCIIKDKEAAKYAEGSNEIFGSVVMAPLYFWLKDIIRSNEYVLDDQTFKYIEIAKKKFPDDFEIVSILIGGFFGYKKFYDTLYEKLDLRFFKQLTKNTIIPADEDKKKTKKKKKTISSTIPKPNDSKIITKSNESNINSRTENINIELQNNTKPIVNTNQNNELLDSQKLLKTSEISDVVKKQPSERKKKNKKNAMPEQTELF